jgi:hypothetical protein
MELNYMNLNVLHFFILSAWILREPSNWSPQSELYKLSVIVHFNVAAILMYLILIVFGTFPSRAYEDPLKALTVRRERGISQSHVGLSSNSRDGI